MGRSDHPLAAGQMRQDLKEVRTYGRVWSRKPGPNCALHRVRLQCPSAREAQAATACHPVVQKGCSMPDRRWARAPRTPRIGARQRHCGQPGAANAGARRSLGSMSSGRAQNPRVGRCRGSTGRDRFGAGHPRTRSLERPREIEPREASVATFQRRGPRPQGTGGYGTHHECPGSA